MAAIRHEPAMADVGLGRGCLQTRDFTGSTYERKIPVNFLLFTGSLDLLSHKLSFRNPAPERPERATLNAPTADDCGPYLLAAVFVRLRNRFDIFRKRSQLPQTKPTGKTVVKITFEHEQHGGWPNEPERVQSRQRPRWGRRKAGHESPLNQVRPFYSLAAIARGSSATGRSNLPGG
jgi:hypothetical protein